MRRGLGCLSQVGTHLLNNSAMKAGLSLRLPSVQRAAISILVTIIAVLAVSIFFIGSGTLIGKLRQFDFLTLGLCLVLMLWQVGCRFLRWLMFTRALGLKLPVHENAVYYTAAFGMTLTPGRLGETLRLWFLHQRLVVPYRQIVGLYFADRISDATGYLVLLAVGTIGYATVRPAAWGFALLVAVIVVAVMQPRPIIRLLTAGYGIVRRGRNQVAWLRRAVRNASVLFQPKVFLPGLTIGTIGWLAAPVVLILSLRQLGIDFALLRAVAIYATAALAGGATMLPGGGGAPEAVLVLLLWASGVPLDDAISAMIMTRVSFLWLPVGIGIATLPIAMRTVRVARP